MKHDSNLEHTGKLELVERYLHLTRITMPELACTKNSDWPVRNDHCFQRIVLDAVCKGVWYQYIARPAYKNMNLEQAQKAVEICENIISGQDDLAELNRMSLSWRGKQRPLL